jgi:hypothetical protein
VDEFPLDVEDSKRADYRSSTTHRLIGHRHRAAAQEREAAHRRKLFLRAHRIGSDFYNGSPRNHEWRGRRQSILDNAHPSAVPNSRHLR